MGYQFELAYLTIPDCSPVEMIQIAASAGYDYVGLRPISMGDDQRDDFAADRALFQAVKAALGDTGVKLNDIELARIYDGVDIRAYESVFQAGAELGATDVTTSIWSDDWNASVDAFGQLCDLAKQYGLTVNIEFVTWANVSNLAQTADVLAQAGRENGAVLVDTLHVHRSRVACAEFQTFSPKCYRYVHLCDAPAPIPDGLEELIFTGRSDRMYVGQGGIEIAEMLRHLPRDLILGAEIPNVKQVEAVGPQEHARRCLTTMKDYLKTNALL